MAFRMNGKTNEIAQIAKNNRGEYIRVQKVIPTNGLNSIDIRLMYTNGEEEILPTQKGVRISDEILSDVVYAIIKGMGYTELGELIDKIIDGNGDIDIEQVFDGADSDDVKNAIEMQDELREALESYSKMLNEDV